MGPSETAIMIPGAVEKLTFLTGTGRHRAQFIYFFRMQIGSRTPSGIGLMVGSRLHRIRRRYDSPSALEAIARLFMVVWAALMRELAEICWKRRRMRRRRLHVYSTDPRRPQGHLFGGDRQDSTSAAALALEV